MTYQHITDALSSICLRHFRNDLASNCTWKYICRYSSLSLYMYMWKNEKQIKQDVQLPWPMTMQNVTMRALEKLILCSCPWPLCPVPSSTFSLPPEQGIRRHLRAHSILHFLELVFFFRTSCPYDDLSLYKVQQLKKLKLSSNKNKNSTCSNCTNICWSSRCMELCNIEKNATHLQVCPGAWSCCTPEQFPDQTKHAKHAPWNRLGEIQNG